MDSQELDHSLSVRDAAAQVGSTKKKIRQQIREGVLKGFCPGKRKLWVSEKSLNDLYGVPPEKRRTEKEWRWWLLAKAGFDMSPVLARDEGIEALALTRDEFQVFVVTGFMPDRVRPYLIRRLRT